MINLKNSDILGLDWNEYLGEQGFKNTDITAFWTDEDGDEREEIIYKKDGTEYVVINRISGGSTEEVWLEELKAIKNQHEVEYY